MTGLTQTEFALALIGAGVALLIVRHWRALLIAALVIVFLRKD
jgi:hypothetical protein